MPKPNNLNIFFCTIVENLSGIMLGGKVSQFPVIMMIGQKLQSEYFSQNSHQIYVVTFFLQQENILDIPVVLMCSTILHQQNCNKIYLPLGSIVRAISKFKEWLYVETVHGEDGYIESEICLPLGQSSLSTIHSTPAFGADMTRFLTSNSNIDDTINYSERNIDVLYLQVAGMQHRIENSSRISLVKVHEVKDEVRLFARNDYISNSNQTLSVRRGEVVHLIHAKIKGWFWIRNKENKEGFIPAAITNL